MQYAKVVVGLPVEGPFDYFIPPALSRSIKIGTRVKVDFGYKKIPGYVVGICAETSIKDPKPVLEALDNIPSLSAKILRLTKKLSGYYCCSWGQAIETALPQVLRTVRKIDLDHRQGVHRGKNGSGEITLVYDLDGQERWNFYIQRLRETLDNKQSALVIFPEIHSLIGARERIEKSLNIPVAVLYRNKPDELGDWLSIKIGKFNVVLGLRSAIFAPLVNLGLVIIDQEDDYAYKQDQVPHYHVREVAMMRAGLEKLKLILCSSNPSLESYHLAITGKIKYVVLPRKRAFPRIKLISYFQGKKKESILSAYLLEALNSIVSSKGKALLFLNRKGFAVKAFCRHCNKIFKCPRCNSNLVYHFKEARLSCHHCNFWMEAPAICPECNSDYIRYSGTGAEKLESDIARMFPAAKIKRADNIKDLDDRQFDIFISTGLIIKATDVKFDVIGVLSVDEALNYIDFRAQEKVFRILSGLSLLTDNSMIIQTRLATHHCFQALSENDNRIFYNEELKQRRQLSFPPFRHLAYVVLRGKKEERVKSLSEGLFSHLNNNRAKGIKILSLNPGQPAKLRGNFYWRILISSAKAEKITDFLKINLKGYPHSGIIITADIDPI